MNALIESESSTGAGPISFPLWSDTASRVATRAISTLLALAAVAASCLLSVPVAKADELSIPGQAEAIMRLPYDQFIAYKQQNQPAPFDWNDDGCSGPKVAKFIYADLFNGPCEQHDFGYDNYGHGPLALGLDENTRAWIDRRLLDEMNRVCSREFDKVWQTYNRIFCKGEASHVYAAVRHGGRPAYYDK